MALSKNLKNLCLDVLYDYGKTITDHISKSGKEEERLQSTLYRLIKVFELWNLPSCVQGRDDIKWEFRIQDVQTPDYNTLTIGLHSSAEFERFIAFLRHLISNWFQDVKLQKLFDGDLSFIVTHPAPVWLHIFPHDDTDLDKRPRFSTSKSSHLESVSEIISRLLKDFGLCTLKEPEKLSDDTKEQRKGKKIRSQNRDAYPEFQNEIFNTDFHHLNTPSDVLLQQLERAYISTLDRSQKPQSYIKDDSFALGEQSGLSSSRNPTPEIEHLEAENANLKKRIATLRHEFEAQRTVLKLKIDELIDENRKIGTIISEKDVELQETFLELGRVSVDLTRVQNEKKRNELFNKTYKSNTASTQTSDVSEWSAITLRARNDQTTPEDEGMHEQESLNETASLAELSHSGVEGNIYNSYRLLLLLLSHNLLKDDVFKLKIWVETEFGIDTSGNVHSIFLELDRMKVISTTKLRVLKTFFESILRYDFVCLIESFLGGDYKELKNFNRAERATNRGINGQNGSSSQRWRHQPSTQSSSRSSDFQSKFQGNAAKVRVGDGGAGISNAIPRHTQRSEATSVSDTQKHRPAVFQPISIPFDRGGNVGTSQGVLVTDGGRREESEVQASGPMVRGNQGNTSRSTDPGSSEQKLSKFQRPDSSGGRGGTGARSRSPDDDDSQWLCSHYKRRCYVKFECCNQFWPCHRCHNNQSACGRRKLKSRDTKRIKCVVCNQEQEFAQYCSRCNAKFARYFCGLCKHLTGTDDNPYHCEKCGICRIHGDRSFHCDICGVCLDVQLRGNHRCREGSAHDECCICLEDAFTGCQILPCSHKVHKECATQMIRSGITRCPICRESFAHKLERRPNSSKKPPGKQ